VQEVFNKMMSLKIAPEATNGKPLFNGQIHLCATVGFAGEWNGCVSIQCGEGLAYYLTSKLLCAEIGTLERKDIWDAMGEIVNMVGGHFKANFAETFNSGIEAFKMSIPSVIMGKNYQMFALGNGSMPETILKTDGEKFSINLVLTKKER